MSLDSRQDPDSLLARALLAGVGGSVMQCWWLMRQQALTCRPNYPSDCGAVCLQPEKEGVMKSWGEQNKRWNLFVSRFFECPFCFTDDKKREDEVAECMSAYLEHYEFAFCRFHRYMVPSYPVHDTGRTCLPDTADVSINIYVLPCMTMTRLY